MYLIELPLIPFNNGLFPEAMPFILKAIQTVDSGLLRLKLQMKCEPFSKLTYLLLFWVWFKFEVSFYSIDLLNDRSIR